MSRRDEPLPFDVDEGGPGGWWAPGPLGRRREAARRYGTAAAGEAMSPPTDRLDLLSEHVHAISYDLERKETEAILDVVGATFGYAVRVRIEQPRWMPRWLYRRLMRSVVIEETPVK